MKKINWRRGLFRIWIAVSVVWILCVAGVMWEPINRAVNTHTWTATSNATGKEISVRSDHKPTNAELDETFRNDSLGIPRIESPPLWREIALLLLLAITLPAALLAGGWATEWMVRGFRA